MAFIIATEVTKHKNIFYIIFEMYKSIHVYILLFNVTFGKQCCTVVFQQYLKYKLTYKNYFVHFFFVV